MLVETQRHGRVAVVTLHRPERLNAVNYPLRSELMATLARLNADSAVGAIVLTGAGRGFCAGEDLSEAASITLEHVSRLFNHQRGMYLAMRDLTKGCVAAVNGVAAGEGLHLALCADLRVAHPGVRVGMPEVAMGQPNMLGAYLLSLHGGLGLAREMALTGEMIDAARAYDLGLLSVLVPEDQVLPRAIEEAERIAGQPPLAVSLTKRRFRDVTQAQFEAASDATARAAVESFSHGEPQIAMRKFLHAHGKVAV
jgi:enoyl-CoA hydratase/carnithine racemase